MKRRRTPAGLEVLILSGATGRPVAGATVDLYAYNWRKGHAKIETKETDADGRAWFAPRDRGGSFFLLAKKGRDVVIDADGFYLGKNGEPGETRAALVYTDRSIYRPGQKLYWKVLAYKGRTDLGRISPESGRQAGVWLEDINGQRVAEATVTTNAFGTASGEFVIPAAGRPLGGWRLRTSPDGYAAVRVEEYKRPTFEVTVKDPEKPLRLNKPAALKGEARYYFGLPVTGGEAVWQVKREPVYPRWWWWGWREPGGTRSQTVAGGRAKIDADGAFAVEFTPRADERKDAASSGLSYRYTLTADVTDEGGETRSASRSFRLGFVSVEARAASDAEFLSADAKGKFTVVRTDLNGTPKAGKGSWRVVKLVQPEKALLPADQPLPDQRRFGRSSLPADARRPVAGALGDRWTRRPSSACGRKARRRPRARPNTTTRASPRSPSRRSAPGPIACSTKRRTISARRPRTASTSSSPARPSPPSSCRSCSKRKRRPSRSAARPVSSSTAAGAANPCSSRRSRAAPSGSVAGSRPARTAASSRSRSPRTCAAASGSGSPRSATISS